tara:strand:- start:3845 stop:4732 length:888 start_codon:yes stop_codon:yes gene_type:complete
MLDCFIEENKYWCFTYNDEGKPIGLIIHKHILPKFIIDNNYNDSDPYIFCDELTFNKIKNINDNKKFKKIDIDKIEEEEKLNLLTKKNEDSDDSDDDADYYDDNSIGINYLTKSSMEYSGYNRYICRKIKICNEDKFNENQTILFKELMKFYNKNKYAKVFISGEMGTGKSYFSYILAKKLKCYLCDCFNPTEPAENLSNLYTTKKLSGDQPLIILIDEIDVIINNIHNNKIEKHKHYPILTRDKMTWNGFLDKIDYGLFPNLILILTSNTSKKDIDKLDQSYLREGRINIYKEF